MSAFTKRKHVAHEVLLGALEVPSENQKIVRVLGGRGNNLHEVEEAGGCRYLASMPTKFRRNFWIKRGDFILVESIPEGAKVKAEIALILTPEHKRFYRQNGCWPQEFEQTASSQEERDEDGLFVNVNRLNQHKTSNDSDSDSDDSDESSESDSKAQEE